MKKIPMPTSPACDLCQHHTGGYEPALYDVPTILGSWANVCQQHFDEYAAAGADALGFEFVLAAYPLEVT